MAQDDPDLPSFGRGDVPSEGVSDAYEAAASTEKSESTDIGALCDDALLLELLKEQGEVDDFEAAWSDTIDVEAEVNDADPEAGLPEDWEDIEARVRDQIAFATQVAEAARRFQELFQGVPIACFCFDSSGRILEWNRACERIFCRSAEHVLERPAWDVVGRAEDREITRALVISVISGESYEGFEWQDIAEDGTTRYFLANTYPLRSIEGAITGGISANIDISARKYAEHALQESEERWYLAVRGNNDGIWDWNARTGQTYFSARCAQILGYDEETEVAVDRYDWLKHIHPEDRESVAEAFRAHLERLTEYYYAEYRVFAKDGSVRWILDRGQALWNRNGQVLRVAGSFTDITERKKYEEELHEAKGKLEELASRDGLTGLKNRRAFQDRLEMEFERARRYDHPLSIILLDVDKFKLYNDTYGHPAGDLVLKTVAHLLEAVTRDSDFVARYGGEEFVLLLPHTSAEAAMRVAERCRSKVENHSWPDRQVTASFGIATLHPGVTYNRDEFVKAADEALYASKESGRNRVTHVVNIEEKRLAA
jgi:diguanylate cyclase (GGDEF)-like protein/PAS domain S-box-containing protein